MSTSEYITKSETVRMIDMELRKQGTKFNRKIAELREWIIDIEGKKK